jgi:type IV pilus assembly protein PilA
MKKGFSLVEVMIVVAIIGILSAIAVPNFQRYQRKARQKEALANLQAVYSGEKNYLAEYNSYAANLLAIGWAPDGNLRYNVGFAATTVWESANDPNMGMYGGLISNADGLCGSGIAGISCTASGEALTAGDATATAFTAQAVGNAGGPVLDTWTIDRTKTLLNTQDGL